MPISMLHEALVLLFRSHPSLAVELLQDTLGVQLPPFHSLKLELNEVGGPKPIGHRADLIVTLRDAANKILRAIVLEVQLHIDGRKRTLPDAIAVWHALVGGRVSLVERESHGQRHYLVLENAPVSRKQRLLSQNEASVVGLAARGLTGKHTAYALGLSTAAVSGHLASAAMKFGLPTRLALVRLASQFSFDKELVDTTRLTAAEREILELIRVGLSNRAIAERRDRSERTIANQVAALLEKTGSPSRRALVTSR